MHVRLKVRARRLLKQQGPCVTYNCITRGLLGKYAIPTTATQGDSNHCHTGRFQPLPHRALPTTATQGDSNHCHTGRFQPRPHRVPRKLKSSVCQCRVLAYFRLQLYDTVAKQADGILCLSFTYGVHGCVRVRACACIAATNPNARVSRGAETIHECTHHGRARQARARHSRCMLLRACGCVCEHARRCSPHAQHPGTSSSCLVLFSSSDMVLKC